MYRYLHSGKNSRNSNDGIGSMIQRISNIKTYFMLGGRPFDSWGRDIAFFCEKKIVQQILEKKFVQ